MLWAIGGIVVGLLLGGFLVFVAIARYLTSGLGRAFGYPSAPWWKFWR
jgi:hypothetical protein